MMTKLNIRAVALDLDGTLAGGNFAISARSAAVVERLERSGVTPIIVTGRTERAALSASRGSGLSAPVISCNGAVVTDAASGERLFLRMLEVGFAKQLLAFGEEHRLEPILWNATEMFAPRATWYSELLEKINQQPVLIAPVDTVDKSALTKIMLCGEAQWLNDITPDVVARMPRLKRSLDVFYETSDPGATKWEALHFVLMRLGIAPEECMGIADGETDIDWLGKIGLAVAVQNARPEVHAIAAVHIGHHANDAVAEYLESYFGLRAGHV